MKAVIDTNILIDYLNAEKRSKKELELYKQIAISRITWMEVLIGATDPTETTKLKNFLDRFEIFDLDETIAEKSIELRKQYKIRLPDAIIWASAQVNNYLLVTRNIKDFPAQEPSIRIPYKL